MNSARMIRSGTHQERDEARHRQQQRQLDRAVLRMARAGLVAGRDPARHLRQQHGADRDADHADRQLVEPVGVVERRQRAGGEEARDDGVGEQRDLGAGRAERRRPERLEEALDVVVERGQRNAGSTPLRARVGRRPAAPRDTPAISTPQAAAWPAVGKNAASASVAIIDRLSRIGAAAARREAVERIEDAAVERHQRDQQQIGKRDAGELDREREAAGIVARSRAPAARSPPGVKTSATASSTTWTANSSVKMRSANSSRRLGAALRRGCAHRPARRRR